MHIESCVLNTQNTYESAPNQINSPNTSKNDLLNILRGSRIFEYALRQKIKTRIHRKSAESFLNQKALSVNGLPLLENC